MRRKKGLIIDPSDICYEEECEEIGFEAPGDIKGNLVQGFSFTNEPINFTPVTKDRKQIKGGASGIASAVLNALMRTVSVMFSLGKAVGSAIRRTYGKNYC